MVEFAKNFIYNFYLKPVGNLSYKSIANMLISPCRSFADHIVKQVISDFKASAEATEVRPKLETFQSYSLTVLKLIAELIPDNFR